MSRAIVNAYCAGLPGAEVSDPWGGGHDAWKVGGKLFAIVGSETPGVSLKTDSVETAELLIEAGLARRAPYLHKSWVLIPWGMKPSELRQRLANSYRLIRAGLPKSTQASVAPFDG